MSKTVSFFIEFGSSILNMSDENAGALFKAAFAHEMGADFDTENCSDVVKAVLPLMLDQLDRMADVKESRSKAGAIGGKVSKPKQTEANGSKRKQNEAKAKQTEAPSPSPSPIPSPSPKESGHFVPPTAEQVSDYCIENGYQVDAERFVNFYSSKGWMVGKSKMKDWKAAVRNWSARDKKEAPKEAKTDYRSQLLKVDYGALLRRQ